MKKIRPLVAACILGAGLSTAYAQDISQQVEQREHLMEEISDNAKILGAMAKGEQPYDAAKAEAALDVIIDHIKEFPTHFPEGSSTGTGHDTRALPAIWENKADFEEHAQALAQAANHAREVAPEGLEAFQGAFRDVGRACGACHDMYRAKDKG